MARKKPTAQAEFVLFNVLYEDGTLTSNRRVPSSALGGLEGDEPARAIIEAQDNEIAARSGRTRSRVKSIGRSAAQRHGGSDLSADQGARRGSDGNSIAGGNAALPTCGARAHSRGRATPPWRTMPISIASHELVDQRLDAEADRRWWREAVAPPAPHQLACAKRERR